jgi:medium-chain acyl-[acyl-carrier-protein] hydrolase
MNIFKYETNIEFCDIDEFNNLSIKGLVRILGEVAGLHSDLVGYGLTQIPQTHLSWMILNWRVQLLSTPAWNSRLIVKTWARDFSRIASHRDFEVYDTSNNLVAIASSKWILVNTDTMKLTKITPEISNAYEMYNKSVFPDEIDDTSQDIENSMLSYEYKITQRDIDTNHHVNNLYYIDYGIDSLPQNIDFTKIKNLDIIYKKQFKKGDVIKCLYTFDENTNKHIVNIKDENFEHIHTIIRFF